LIVHNFSCELVRWPFLREEFLSFINGCEVVLLVASPAANLGRANYLGVERRLIDLVTLEH
jgi:hypothetical protein